MMLKRKAHLYGITLLLAVLFYSAGMARAADVAEAQKDARAMISALYEAGKADDTQVMEALMSPRLSEKLHQDDAMLQQWFNAWRMIGQQCEFTRLKKPTPFPNDETQFSVSQQMRCCKDLEAEEGCQDKSGYFRVMQLDENWYINE